MILWAFITAAIVYFIDYCISPGEIFGGYSDWIETLPKWLAKPLGGCMVCMGVWVSAFVFVFLHLEAGIGWIMLIPFIAITSLFIRVLIKYF